jgi:hypothetical protein
MATYFFADSVGGGQYRPTEVNLCHFVHKLTTSSRVARKRLKGFTPEAARLANALSAVIAASPVDATQALSAIREVGEEIEVPAGNTDAAFERVRLRSLGVDDELREAEGGGLSDAQFAHSLGIKSRETIRKYREGRRIFGFRKGVRAYRYPAWQIYEGQLLPGLGEVIAILAGVKSYSLFQLSAISSPPAATWMKPAHWMYFERAG